ncbi:alpha/beta fold hydrolase [Micromonospora costi]|uniref:Alpha/beta hydrolase n=1 Tax=Micromonospora costi TaxID=1530042 RepID=A0A3B0AEJ2_9ACTN|nr:alpha/beta hydrolase [Micromonospora costi]RKN59038.1 alpha/beta hydrolase [Micromonospora costi]
MVFPGFTSERISAGKVAIHVRRGGDGPPLLLLHGYPQTHVTWHRVAPELARHFTVVCTDLRGYGDSDKPPGGGDHRIYSKRALALDQVEVMRRLGFDRFAVGGHDRGARVALRLALDHPDAVSHLALLDIVPTRTIYDTIDQRHATTVWRYFFLIQPHDLPERLIGGDPQGYLRWTLDEWCGTPGALDGAATAEYERCFDHATIHASCEDYRAGATIDLTHDRADASRTLACPTLALWSRGGIGSAYDVPGIWRARAEQFTGGALDCGHFIPEERPRETVQALRSLLAT